MVKRPLVFAAALVLVLGVAAAAGAYFVIQAQSLSHAPEETARFLPEDTSLYVSVNLRPGAGQLMKARDVLALFRENPAFDERLDEVYGEIEAETGIDVKEDLFPWLGPEIAVAVSDFEGSAWEPEMVGFIGTTDPVAAESFVRKLLAYADADYEETRVRGRLAFVDPSSDYGPHVAVTEDYIVVATEGGLESTLDRMDSAGNGGRSSLYDNPGFQEAREAAESPRFGIIYVAPSGVAEFGGAVVDEITGGLVDFDDLLPDFIVASASFIDRGIRVSTSFDYPARDRLFVPASDNALGSAALAPEDALTLISLVGAQDAWGRLRDEVAYELDRELDQIEAEIGIDIERDILGWMAGELAFAVLLPGGVPFSTDEIHANVYVEFDDRAKALAGMEKIRGALEDGGLMARAVDVGGIDGVVMELGDGDGLAGLTPGYVVLDDYVVIGTTLTALRQAVAAAGGDAPSLRESPVFGRAMEAAGDSTDFLAYANVRRIAREALDQIDETELEEHRDTADPFVAPLEAFLLGADIEEEVVTVSAVITFAKPD